MRASRFSSVLLAVVLVGAVACGGGSSESACADVAADAAAMVEEILAEVSGMSVAEAEQEQMEDIQERFEQRGEELDDRAQEACESEDEFSRLVGEELDDVEVEGELAQLFLEGIRGEFGVEDGGADAPATDAGTES